MSSTTQSIIEFTQVEEKLLTLRHHKKGLAREITRLRTGVSQFEKDRASRRTLLNEQKKARIVVQEDFEKCESFIQKLQTQVPKIRNEKEFAASKKQLEEARKGRGNIEEQLLAIDIKIEGLEAFLSNLASELRKTSRKFNKAAKPLKEQQAEAEKQLTESEALHETLFAQLPEKLQKYYTRSVSRGISNPICAIKDKSCGGCHIMLLPQLVNDLMADPDLYLNCSHCSRILIYIPEPEEDEEEEKKKK